MKILFEEFSGVVYVVDLAVGQCSISSYYRIITARQLEPQNKERLPNCTTVHSLPN